ncbi:MAG: hypothetical protein V1738_07075 [Patescibacteria group bacterium]
MAQLNRTQIERVAQLIGQLPDDITPLNFYSFFTPEKEIVATDMYPPLNHPALAEFFMFACLHQYGFWLSKSHGYDQPLVGKLNGRECKGSDLLWKSIWRYLERDGSGLEPNRLKEMSKEQMWTELFVDDNGPIAFADRGLRLQITQEYGRQLMAEGLTATRIIAQANERRRQLEAFVGQMKKIQGFAGDIFNKKILLLAMALHNRPEQLLQVSDSYNWQPIVDYHLMRFALRTGMVEIGKDETYLISHRYFVRPAVEHGIRKATFDAFSQIIELSKRTMFFVDVVAWKARRYCPEMSEPDCAKCAFQSVCAKRKDLFQPVYRTINY